LTAALPVWGEERKGAGPCNLPQVSGLGDGQQPAQEPNFSTFGKLP